MRLSVVVLFVSLAGMLGGAAIVGTVMLGVVLMLESLAAGVWALMRDDQVTLPSVHSVPSLADVLERARRVA